MMAGQSKADQSGYDPICSNRNRATEAICSTQQVTCGEIFPCLNRSIATSRAIPIRTSRKFRRSRFATLLPTPKMVALSKPARRHHNDLALTQLRIFGERDCSPNFTEVYWMLKQQAPYLRMYAL